MDADSPTLVLEFSPPHLTRCEWWQVGYWHGQTGVDRPPPLLALAGPDAAERYHAGRRAGQESATLQPVGAT
jgi:hypothetical protein